MAVEKIKTVYASEIDGKEFDTAEEADAYTAKQYALDHLHNELGYSSLYSVDEVLEKLLEKYNITPKEEEE